MMYQDIYICICQNTANEDIQSMSNLQPNCCLKIDFQKEDQHAGGKWLIHDTKRRNFRNIIKNVFQEKHRGNVPFLCITFKDPATYIQKSLAK